MDSMSGGNPTNNPRLDLLHNTGDNEQLKGIAGSYTGAAASVPSLPVVPARPQPQPSARPIPPKPQPVPEAADVYVKAAETKEPVAPVPTPAAPEPRRVSTSEQSVAPVKRRRWPVIAGVVVVLLVVAGAAGWVVLRGHKVAETPTPTPTTVAVSVAKPTQLSQLDNANSAVAAGLATKSTTISLQFQIATNANSGALTPEVELRPVGTAYTGETTASGKAVTAGGSTMNFTVPVENLPAGSYHWQARVSKDGETGDWADFGSTPDAIAFIVDTQAPAAPGFGAVGGAVVSGAAVSSTSNKPAVSGTTEPNAAIKLTIDGGTALKTTADSAGAWTITPTTEITAGAHQLSLIATDVAGNDSPAAALNLTIAAAPATTPVAVTPAVTPPTPETPKPTTLAPTGDNTISVGLISLLLMVVSAAGWIATRRLRETF